MKCHWCHIELALHDSVRDYLQIFQCPDGHVTVTIQEKEVVGYTIFLDTDRQAKDRYRLRYNGLYTTLSMQDKTQLYYSSPYAAILSTNRKIDLIIEDDIIQGAKMINSLKRLKAFT